MPSLFGPLRGLDAKAYGEDETGLLVVVDGAEDWFLQVEVYWHGSGRARSMKAARLILQRL